MHLICYTAVIKKIFYLNFLLIKMCVAVIESMLPCSLFITVRWTSFIYFSFFFYLNSLPFTVSVITVLLISDLEVICLLENVRLPY